VLSLLNPAQASDATNQFLFLTLRLKDGQVTLQKAQVVNGTLKPQLDSTDAAPLLVSLESTNGAVAWKLAIDDPSVHYYEYEDPQQPGQLKMKVAQDNDVEFVVRTPIKPGVRQIAIHRPQPAVATVSSGATRAAVLQTNLLARIELPKEVTR